MKKKKPNVVFIICLIVLIAAIATLVVYQVRLHKRTAASEELAEQVTIEEVSEEEPEETVEEPVTPEIPIDFDALLAQNDDVYAWLRIPDTDIDYPVLQSKEGEDVDYYLNYTIDREEGRPGALYTQYTYNPDPIEDAVTIIYGHNMHDDTYFGTLSDYLDEEFRDSHTEILMYTPEHIYHYELVFTVTYDNRHLLDAYDCSTTDGYDSLLTSIQTERLLPSWIADPFEVTTDDHLLILSTCKDGDNTKRFLVGAKLTETE